METSNKVVLGVVLGCGGLILICCCAVLGTLGFGILSFDPVQTILFSDPTTDEQYFDRGDAYYSLGRYERAVDDYTQAIELNPSHAEAYYKRGNAHALLERYEQAIADYTLATELDPNLAKAWGYLCWFRSILDDAAAAMDACEQGVAADPTDGGIRDSRGLARALTGDFEGAIEDFEFFVEWTANEPGRREQQRAKREAWIIALEAGQNPFDEATLHELLRDD